MNLKKKLTEEKSGFICSLTIVIILFHNESEFLNSNILTCVKHYLINCLKVLDSGIYIGKYLLQIQSKIQLSNVLSRGISWTANRFKQVKVDCMKLLNMQQKDNNIQLSINVVRFYKTKK